MSRTVVIDRGRSRASTIGLIALAGLAGSLLLGVGWGARRAREAIAAPQAPAQDLRARMDAAQLWLPAMGPSRPGCEGSLVIQSLAAKLQKAVLITWGGDASCPPAAAGPLKVECSGLISQGSTWSFQGPQLPAGARSGLLLSLDASRPEANRLCGTLVLDLTGDPEAFLRFQTAFLAGERYGNVELAQVAGGAMAAQWTERCGDGLSSHRALRRGDASVQVAALDAEISRLPLLDADWEVLAQNLGMECADLSLEREEGGVYKLCARAQVAPGAAATLRPGSCAPGAGAARVRSSQPVAVVARRAEEGARAAYTGQGQGAADLHLPLPWNDATEVRSILGLHNPSAEGAIRVQVLGDNREGRRGVVRELDIAAGATERLVLGSADLAIEGRPAMHLQVSSLADAQGRRLPLNAALWQERGGLVVAAQDLRPVDLRSASQSPTVLAVPSLLRSSSTDALAPSRLSVHNDVSQPGFTDFVMYIYDHNGLLDFVCQKLDPQGTEFIDLRTWGYVNAGFRGSMVISAVYWEHGERPPTAKGPIGPMGLSAAWSTGGVNDPLGGPLRGDPDLELAPGLQLSAPPSLGGIPVLCPQRRFPPGWEGRKDRLWLPALASRR